MVKPLVEHQLNEGVLRFSISESYSTFVDYYFNSMSATEIEELEQL